MKERKVQTLFVEGKPEPALASALLQARAMGLNVVIKLKTTESNSETQEEFKELGLDDVIMACLNKKEKTMTQITQRTLLY